MTAKTYRFTAVLAAKGRVVKSAIPTPIEIERGSPETAWRDAVAVAAEYAQEHDLTLIGLTRVGADDGE